MMMGCISGIWCDQLDGECVNRMYECFASQRPSVLLHGRLV